MLATTTRAIHPVTGNRMAYDSLEKVRKANAGRRTISGGRRVTPSHPEYPGVPRVTPRPLGPYEALPAYTESLAVGKKRKRCPKAQRRFRRYVLARDGVCQITGEAEDLDACHILATRTFADGDTLAMHLSNGIVLAQDIHVAFDNWRWSIDPEGWVVFSKGYQFPRTFMTRTRFDLGVEARHFVTQRHLKYLERHA